jgi:outer membrane protein assembly factor BamB
VLKIVGDGKGGFEAQRVYESTRMRNHFSSSVRLGRYVYGFDEGFLVCMDLLTGEVQWKEGGFSKGSLTAAEGRLIILGERGKLALAEATPKDYRQLSAFEFSGNKCWTVPVVANGKLYLRDTDRIVCYDIGTATGR